MQNIFINARFLTHQISGVEKFAIELCRELKAIEPNIKFVSPKNVIHPLLAKEFSVITYGKRKGQLWEQLDLPQFLKKNNTPLLINLCNSAPINYSNNVVTIHDLAFIENPKWFSLPFRTWYNYLIPRIVKKAKHILTVSEFSKKELQQKLYVSKNSISVIYNGLSKEILQHSTETKKRKKFILTVGSINPRKNIAALIEGFNASNLADYELLIVGAKNSNFKKEKFEVNNDKIKFLGYLSDQDLWNLYKEAQLFVSPSLYEGFGIPVLEATYFKCPTIVSNLEVYQEVYNNFGLMYSQGNDGDSYSKSITEALSKELNNKELTEEILSKCSYNKGAKKVNTLIKTDFF